MRRSLQLPGSLLGPFACATTMVFGPLANLVLCERQHAGPVPHVPLSGEELGQGRAARQTAKTLVEGVANA